MVSWHATGCRQSFLHFLSSLLGRSSLPAFLRLFSLCSMTIVKACFVSASHHFRALSPSAISTNRYPSQCRFPKRNALLFSPFFSTHSSSTIFLRSAQCRYPRIFADGTETSVPDREVSEAQEYLAIDGPVFQKTLRLVECSMFAAVAGLAYFLSNSLAIENYFGCFFALPIVVSSMRWGVAAGRKTMVRAVGAIGYVLLSSFLIRENILALITINIHASLTFLLTAMGINTIPSMGAIYAIFGSLLLLNCGFFVFLLHIIYAIFLTKLGMRTSLTLPRWLEKAI